MKKLSYFFLMKIKLFSIMDLVEHAYRLVSILNLVKGGYHSRRQMDEPLHLLLSSIDKYFVMACKIHQKNVCLYLRAAILVKAEECRILYYLPLA